MSEDTIVCGEIGDTGACFSHESGNSGDAVRPRVRIAATPAARLRGLLFRPPSWLGEGGVLVLVPCSSVHTFGMHRRLDIAFADDRGVATSTARDVGGGRVLSDRRAVLVLERFSDPRLPWYAPGEQALAPRAAGSPSSPGAAS